MITISFLSFTTLIIIAALIITLFTGVYISRKQNEIAKMELEYKEKKLKVEERRLKLEERLMNDKKE